MLLESLKMALESLIANKMRSILTMLGIIVGISAVIAIFSLGEGGKASVLGEFNEIGASTVQVQVKGSVTESEYITLDDIRELRKKTDVIRYISGYTQRIGSISSEDKTKRAVFLAVDEDYGNINSVEIIYGRKATQTEHEEGRNVVLLEEESAKKLFGRPNAVGEQLYFTTSNRKITVTVVGVFRQVGMSLFAGMGGSDEMPVFVSMPLTTMIRANPNAARISEVMVMANSAEQATAAGDLAVRVLSIRHHTGDREVYTAESMQNMLDQVNKIMGFITAFISAVAAISLFVGGIGVMNIMLVSVTERIREIGIRKAIGATTTNIMSQFITESVCITLLGGIIGIIAGLGLATLIGNIAGITPILQVGSILLTVVISSAVGLLSGIYPAYKAAKLDPIVALRYE